MNFTNLLFQGFQSIFLQNNQKALSKINDILDAALIRQQAENGVLDFKHYSKFVLHVMSLACAPIRDEQISKLKEIDDVVDLFRGILETLSVMKLDTANCMLQSARSVVIENSVQYEKKKFKEYLEYYTDGFPATESWLRRNKPAAVAAASSSTQTPEQEKKSKDTIFNAYMELLSWNAENKFPEVKIKKIKINTLNYGNVQYSLCSSLKWTKTGSLDYKAVL